MIKLLTVLLAAAMLACGCQKDPPQANAPHPRVVSYSPALTKMLFDMGLGDHVVAVTAYCELPAGQTRTVIGDQQNINAERIVWAKPDLVFVQQKSPQFAAAQRVDPNIKIESFTIETLDDIGVAMERIGQLIGQRDLGKERRGDYEARLARVRDRVAGLKRPRVLFLTGINPPSVAGRDSFIHGMIELAGGEDVTADLSRWTQINVERIIEKSPEVIVVQVLPGQEASAREELLKLKGVPAIPDHIRVVTDKNWTIPSARLADLAGELAGLIHGDLPADRPAAASTRSGGAKP